tara:strand:- start:6497 stop:8347 length:1851 start_codon:yes stop_codon:yes gene_type:complete
MTMTSSQPRSTGIPTERLAQRSVLSHSSAHEAISSISKLPFHLRGQTGLSLIKHLFRAIGAYQVDFRDETTPTITLAEGPTEEDLISCVWHTGMLSRQERKARTDYFEVQDTPLAFITVPILQQGKIDYGLCLVMPYDDGIERTGELATLQWFALLFYALEDEVRHQVENLAAQRIGGLFEAMEKTGCASDFPTAATQLVDILQVLAKCDRVALATTQQTGNVKLQAVSGMQSDSPLKSAGGTAIQALLTETVHGKRELDSTDNAVFLASSEIQSLLGNSTSQHYWCAPLYYNDRVVGAWLFLWKKKPEGLPELMRFLKTAQHLIGPQLHLLHKGKPGAMTGRLHRMWGRAKSNQRRFVVSLLICLGAFAAAPIPIPVDAPVTLQPTVRRIVSAPFDGILRKAHVEPGEVVQTGQLLADLDDREIRWQLADANARRLRAEKQADAAMSSGQIAESQMARLEADSLAETANVLTYRQENLQIKSPIEGRVLRGDLKRNEGAIIRLGERLFEIGSLDSMQAEIAVEESDIALIRDNASVTMRFDSHPGKTWKANLTLVSPHSEFRNGENVFVCQATIANPEESLRPGGIGRATIHGPWRPAVWTILRAPTNWLLRQLP